MTTTKDFQTVEKNSQLIADEFYKSQNFRFDRSKNCRKFDLIIEGRYKGEKCDVKIEEKFRSQDYNDFLIEFIQCLIDENNGWFYETEADYIFYWVKMEKLYQVNWKMFKKWFLENWKKIPMQVRLSKDGYGLTVNIAIYWKDIPQECYKKIINNA